LWRKEFRGTWTEERGKKKLILPKNGKKRGPIKGKCPCSVGKILYAEGVRLGKRGGNRATSGGSIITVTRQGKADTLKNFGSQRKGAIASVFYQDLAILKKSGKRNPVADVKKIGGKRSERISMELLVRTRPLKRGNFQPSASEVTWFRVVSRRCKSRAFLDRAR